MISQQPAVGHRSLLVGLFLLGLGNLFLFIFTSYDFALFALFHVVVLIASVVVVFIDARAINRANGRDVVGVGTWTILVLFFWIITMPWYVFSRRGKAISAPVETNGARQDALEAIRKLGELKEKGIVTEDEFQRKKQELLSRV